MEGWTLCIIIIMIVFVIPETIFLFVGFFTPHWVSDSACDAVGLFYKCCSVSDDNIRNITANSTSDVNLSSMIIVSRSNNETAVTTKCEYKGAESLDVRILGLEATTLALVMLPVLLIPLLIRNDVWIGYKDFLEWFTILSTFSHLIAAVFSFSGCMIVVSEYESSQFGYSFILCLSHGCYGLFALGTLSVSSVIGYMKDKSSKSCDLQNQTSGPQTHKTVEKRESTLIASDEINSESTLFPTPTPNTLEHDFGSDGNSKDKNESNIVHVLSKLNFKKFFVFSVGKCHCVYVKNKDDN
ncbi:uncharacterized protein LOC128548376 [Mercenaria mercenaria]|uniref:uncharacterized protein LOC128548376 n=1 Tax=Mercenaria mercenaria TaxID=6596 RepID=UPI00234E5383|nr:uncharacterized protein LOC128548376 [Mercenaria mercenaria]